MKRLTAVVWVIVLLAAGSGRAQTDLVTNGGFETGDFSGWSGVVSDLKVSTAQPHSGTYAVRAQDGAQDDILQTLTTTPGQYYDLSFWLRGSAGETSSLSAYWGGSEIWSETDISHGYRQGTSGPLLAAGAATELKFSFSNQSLADHPFFFDDVSVTVYEPTDGTWIAAAGPGKRWTAAANWQDGKIADGPGGTAYLYCDPTPPGSGETAVVPRALLGGDRTIGHLEFRNNTTGEWVLGSAADTGTLTLATPVGDTPSIHTISNADVRRSLAGTQGFVKSGAGALALFDASAYTGITDLAQGTLEVRNDNALGVAGASDRTLVRDGATLKVWTDVHTPESLTLSGNGVNGLGAVTLFDGSTVAGDITLAGDARIRQQSGTGTLAGDLSLPDSDVLNLWVNAASTLDLTGGISGTGGLLVNKPGTVELTGDSSYGGATILRDGLLIAGSDHSLGSGTVRIDGGTLQIASGVTLDNRLVFTARGGTLGGRGTYQGNLTVGANGAVAPGSSPGLLTIDGNYTQDPLASLNLELGGLLRGDEYDALVVTGRMTLAGTLDVTLWNGFDPVAGNCFDVLDWGRLSGQFTQIDLPGLDTGLAWDLSGLYATGTLSVYANAQPVPIPGAVALALFGLATATGLLRRQRAARAADAC